MDAGRVKGSSAECESVDVSESRAPCSQHDHLKALQLNLLRPVLGHKRAEEVQCSWQMAPQKKKRKRKEKC